jgi:pyruvate, water dikinase
MNDLIRPLTALRREHADLFGGKSAMLGESIASGLNVPGGFAASTGAFEEFLAYGGLGQRIAERLASIDPADVDELYRASTEIAAEMRAVQLPEAFRLAVEDAYAALGNDIGCDAPPVAVRSSARGEDSVDATHAGQQDTQLWVRGVDGLCEAIRGCWISLYSPTAISYRAALDTRDDSPAMGITVQEMVDSAISGVMFTCSPLTGDPSVVAINASWGLGLSVVGGDITPDEFLVSKVTREVLRKTINEKSIAYAPARSGRGIEQVAVPRHRWTAPSLREEQLAELVEVADKIEQHFGEHQDIEWAIGRGDPAPGRVYVLQVRPVTGLRRARDGLIADTTKASPMSLMLRTLGVKSAEG